MSAFFKLLTRQDFSVIERDNNVLVAILESAAYNLGSCEKNADRNVIFTYCSLRPMNSK